MNTKTLLTIFLLFIFLSPVSADDINSLIILKRDLGSAIKTKSDTEIWYCPDNTCDMYQIRQPHPDFHNFIYLHLFHKSDYVYLGHSFGGMKAFREIAVEEPQIRSQVENYCPNHPKDINCILDQMKTNLGIRICFGRYDEGYFCYGCSENENICKKY